MVMCREPVILRAAQRLAGRVLRAHRHQPGHLVLGQLDLLAPELGERQVGNLKLAGIHIFSSSSCRLCKPDSRAHLGGHAGAIGFADAGEEPLRSNRYSWVPDVSITRAAIAQPI